MIYKYESELRRGAELCSNALNSEGYSTYIVSNSLREYSVKLSVNGSREFGKFSVYYSPKKKKYSLVTNEITYPNVAEKISEICLPQLNAMLPFDGPESVEPPAWNQLPELFVDGSFREGIAAYAFALIDNNSIIHSSAGVLTEKETAGTNQIAGELEAIIKGLEWCRENNYKEVKVCHDLINSQKWASGEFKANNAVTKRYVNFIKTCHIGIRWKKIQAHTGVEFNEFVDRLAAKAVEEYTAKHKLKKG